MFTYGEKCEEGHPVIECRHSHVVECICQQWC